MSNVDDKSYLGALKNLDTIKRPDAFPEIRLCENSAKKLECIMRLMEWDLTTAINSSIVYAFKRSEDDLLKPIKFCRKFEGEKIQLELSLKNINRIKALETPSRIANAKLYTICVVNSISILFNFLEAAEIE